MSSFLFISATPNIISFDLISPLLHFTASVLQHFIPKLATVTSYSAVGYQNDKVPANQWNMRCSTFLPTGTDGKAMTISDLKPNADFQNFSDNVQLLNGNGGTLAMFVYCDEATAEAYASYGLQGSGWFDADEYNNWNWSSPLAPKNDYPIPFGTMFVIQAASSDSGLVYAGEVIPRDWEFTVTAGVWNMIGNSQPTNLEIQDIIPNAFFQNFSDNIQLLNGNGGTLAMFVYCDEATAEAYASYGLQGSGWFDADEYNNWNWSSPLAPKNEYPIPSGLGFVVQVGADGAGLIIPTPLPVQAK